jgi:hypothetical protein
MVKKPGTGVSTRSKVGLQRNLEKSLLAYAAAASGGLIALSHAAEAEIIYTPSNIPVPQSFGQVAIAQLDLNNDGVADFAFSNFSYSTHGFGAHFLRITPDQTTNEIAGITIKGQSRVTAAALQKGVTVGPSASFQSSPHGLYMGAVFTGTSGQDFGSWLVVETAYVGLKLVVNGEVHYGWARVKLVAPGAYLSGSIYGYAYESVANQPIVTGQTSGTAGSIQPESQTSRPATTSQDREVDPKVNVQSLGMLAAGAPATALWRGNSVMGGAQ